MIFNQDLFVNARHLTTVSLVLLLSTAATGCLGPMAPFSQEPSSNIPTVKIEPDVTSTENDLPTFLGEDANAIEQDSPQPIIDQIIAITENSIGKAQTCTTPTELQQALPNMTVGAWGDGPLVDTEGVEVTNAQEETLFYALASGWRIGPNRPFTLFYTTHPNHQTAEGIGPGTTIEEAERIYGPASLSYHTQAESREFVRFEHGPANITFRTGTGDEAGIYSERSEYNQTDEYREGATIQSIWISDRSCQDDF